MPFPDPLLPIAAIAILISTGGMWLFNSVSRAIRLAHTQSALGEIAEFLDNTESKDWPTDEQRMIGALQKAQIDWNSCSVTAQGILDGWGRPVGLQYHQETLVWRFRSSGKDGVFDTHDDILATTRERNDREQRAPSS